MEKYNWIELELKTKKGIEKYNQACRVGCWLKFDTGEICSNEDENFPFALITHYSLRFELN